jgi:hypothetical protein
VIVTPNPVPWSDAEIAGCGSDRPNRWIYEQTLRNTGETAITVTDRADVFDTGAPTIRTGLGIAIAAGAESKVTTRYCSVTNVDHFAFTNWAGVDAKGNPVSFTGVAVRLLKK